MGTLFRLLAATDFSAPARHGVERAAWLSKVTGAPLAIVHITELAPIDRLRRLTGSPDGLQQRLHEHAVGELRELADAVSRHLGVVAATELASGALLPELSRQIDTLGADLTVLGVHGARHLRPLVLGSTAERMLGRASSPLLVVKQAAREPYRCLLVPVDFSAASLTALRQALAVAPDANIVLLHTYDVPFAGFMSKDLIDRYRSAAEREARQMLRDLIAQAGLPPAQVRCVLRQGDPVLRIIEQEQELDCDLIVMGKHGENKIEELFLGSVTRSVLAESRADVLVSV